MKVSELIVELRKMDPDLDIDVFDESTETIYPLEFCMDEPSCGTAVMYVNLLEESQENNRNPLDIW